MIRYDPSHRISFSDIFYHPWVIDEDCASEGELAAEFKARYTDILKRQELQKQAQFTMSSSSENFQSRH